MFWKPSCFQVRFLQGFIHGLFRSDTLVLQLTGIFSGVGSSFPFPGVFRSSSMFLATWGGGAVLNRVC